MYNSQMPVPKANELWQALVITGSILTVVGLGAVGIDFATRGKFSFIAANYGVFGLAILAGVALLLVSLIGWAAVLGKVGRKRIAFFALAAPIVTLFIGFSLGGTNAHGPFPLFLLPIAPLIVAGLVVAIMAASART
jgi:hypothetical protein